MEASTPAEQRAHAVAKIKRAISLPRMKDGRRPRMHVEAVSEGERSQLGTPELGADGHLSDDSPIMSESHGDDGSYPTQVEPQPEHEPEPDPPPEPEVDAEHCEVKADDPKTEEDPITSPPATPCLPEDTSTKSPRRRSRSRSRGRNSKDFKGKAKVTQSPHPANALPPTNDSSPDEGPIAPTPQLPGLTSPLLVSPIPAHIALLQAQRLFASPEPGMYYPGTSPPTPLLPTLQDIQRGLFRSNSAAARLMVLQQLAGSEAYDPSLASPPVTPPPLPGKIFRNNTVGGSGGERIQARKVMMRQLSRRLKEAEAEQTSGGEDPQPTTVARRKRRKRASTNRSTVVDDREPPSAASPTTPVLSTAALPRSTPEPARDESDTHVARSPTPNARSPSVERSREDALAKLTGEAPSSTAYDYETPLERRGVVVEEEDDAADHDHSPASPIPRSTYNGRSDASPRVASPRPTPSPIAPLSTSADSADADVPDYLSDSVQEQQEVFPTSPFATPLRERQGPDEDEEDSHTENDAARRSPWNDAYDREISWVAELVPERIPVHDDNDYDDADDIHEPRDHSSSARHHSDLEEHEDEDDDESLPRTFINLKNLVLDIETSPEAPRPSQIPPSPSSASVLHRHLSDDSRIFPARLSISSPSQPELIPSPNTEYLEWKGDESLRMIVIDTTPKKNGDSSQSRWDRVKNAFGRPGSSNGRRSRNNSIRERANNTDSSTSRESGASLTGASKTDKEPPTYFPSSPSAVSPVPPASNEALQKYGGDAKLFPFPGIFPGVKRLEEERRTRSGGLSLNASSPEIASPPTLDEFSAISSGSASSRTPQASPEIPRGRKLSHQVSDTRLFQRFNPGNTPPPLSTPSTSTTQPDPGFPPTPNNTGWLGGKLPTNREGVKTWLRAKGLFPSQSSQASFPGLQQPVSAPVDISQSGSTDVSRKLSDLFDSRKGSELMTDWEDMSRTPTPTIESTAQGGESHNESEPETEDVPSGGSPTPPTPETPALDKPLFIEPRVRTPNGDAQSMTYPTQSMSPAPDPTPSATPDPTSSLDGYASQSSPSSSSPERFLEPTTLRTPGAMILERLDEQLGSGSRGPNGSTFVDDPPRRLLLSSQVLQVANSNTVKDRFLFLFNDILIVAKPVTHDYDALLDMTKPSPLDRKFIVKSVVQLRDVRFTADRDDLPLSSLSSISRNPLVRTFVIQFARDADNAISHFFEKSGTRDDPTVLGQLLFRMLDLDRAKLGDYLSRRSSKVVLKAFIGCFGFGGVRIDKALRVFLQSLYLAPPTRYSNPLEYVSDSFASRWYDANTDLVAYDKDLAIRLVRAIIQLNDVLYGGVIQDLWAHAQIKRNVTSRDFIDAFRRYDPRCLVSDDLLDRIHASIKREPLSQARNSTHSVAPDQLIILKRPIPSRLTYRMQSEPIIVRIPQADPSLTIHLHGNELSFDPPYLTFTRSAEASFRITGTALGLKTVSFSRSGPSSLLYSGLPLSSPIVIERSFMRNTFQIAFVNHQGLKRRYMFSVDDPVMRHNWTISLKRQIDIVGAGQQAQVTGSSPFHRAAEQVAFRVLQETLIPSRSAECDNPHPPFSSLYFSSLARARPLSPPHNNRRLEANGKGTSPSHVRSKSRSQVYHRHGPGKLEHQQLDLLLGGDGTDSPETDAEDGTPSEGGTRLWGGKDLETVCQQNSAIVLVLASSQSDLANPRSSPSPAGLRPVIPIR